MDVKTNSRKAYLVENIGRLMYTFNSTGCVLFFYHVLLFTVGIGTVILGGISLGKT